LIGVDIVSGDRSTLDQIRAECPPHVSLTILELGYSTSLWNGGLKSNRCGGALPAILSLAANSRYVAYLDDDDWWASDHLAGLLSAIAGKQWAFAYRWLVHPDTLWPICRDEWDAVGPGRGINQERYGGFVSPSALMIDMEACDRVLPLWSHGSLTEGNGSDRRIFDVLSKGFTWAASQRHSLYYALSQPSLRDEHHVLEFHRRGLRWVHQPALADAVRRHAARARDQLKRGDIMAARKQALAALAINPEHADSLHCLAQAEAAIGQHDTALQHVRAALAVDDREPAYLETLVGILRASDQTGEATAALAAARRRFPELRDQHDAGLAQRRPEPPPRMPPSRQPTARPNRGQTGPSLR
jgi:tetratricopeptide (TPR) repeat protein